MADAPGIAGQIMHSPTVEKMIQPMEAKGEVAAQLAAAESDRAQDLERRTVGRIRESEGGRVDEDGGREKEKREGRSGSRKKKRGDRDEGLEGADRQGRYIDLTV